MVAGKKKFFGVEIPVLNSVLNVLAGSPEELEGRIIKYDFTRILKGKNLVATLVIKKGENNLLSEFKSLKLVPSYIIKSMRTGISYVEDSFICKFKDGNMRVKPFLLTRKKVHRSIRNALRKKCRELIEEFCKDKPENEIFDSVIFSKLQRQLFQNLKKIYPLSLCEIRVIEKIK